MTTQQMAIAMRSLAGSFSVCISPCGSWYVSIPEVYIRRGGGIRSFAIWQDTPENAILSAWAELTDLKYDEAIEVKKEYKTYFYRWNGFMWKSVERPI